MSEHNYKIKYELKPELGNFTKEEIKNSGLGGTDALILFSLLYPENGSFSMYFHSIDGRNEGEEISDSELWKVWALLSERLSRSHDLSPIKREIAAMNFKAVQTLVMGIPLEQQAPSEG